MCCICIMPYVLDAPSWLLIDWCIFLVHTVHTVMARRLQCKGKRSFQSVRRKGKRNPLERCRFEWSTKKRRWLFGTRPRTLSKYILRSCLYSWIIPPVPMRISFCERALWFGHNGTEFPLQGLFVSALRGREMKNVWTQRRQDAPEDCLEGSWSTLHHANV